MEGITTKKLNMRDMMEYFAVLMIILSSGSVYFTIMNVEITLYVLLAVSVLCALMNGIKASTLKHNMFTFCLIIAIVSMNLIINLEYARFDNDIFILLIRLGSLLLIQSSVTADSFIRKYVNIMFVLAIISLVSFAYTMLISTNLPFLIVQSKNGVPYYYTFFHTVGYRMIYERNAGVFWEAPAYAIFLSIAIIFITSRKDLFKNAKVLLYLFVFIVTILTTLSVYAFLELAILVIYMLVTNKSNGNVYPTGKKDSVLFRKRYYVIGAIVAIIALIWIEQEFGLITHKLINQSGSFNTRFNDTYYSLTLASKNFFSGYGIFNDYTENALGRWGVENNSNGLAILLLGVGFPVLILAALVLLFRLRKLLRLNNAQSFLVMALFFMFYFSEHLWLYTLFISFLFSWHNEKILVDGKERGSNNGRLAKTSVN